MNLFKGVGKGAKAAKNGVVGVGKGVGHGVKEVGKGVGKGVTTVGKGVGQGVTTVGKGVGHGVAGVGNVAVEAASAGVNVAATAGKAGVNVAATAGKAGVNVAATAGKAGVQLGKTAVDAGANGVRTISGRNTPKRKPGVEHTMEIYCSNLYTREFVLGEIEKARKDKNIVNLHFEDMILRESPEITEAATKLLLDTAGSFREMMDDSSARHSSRRTSILPKARDSNTSNASGRSTHGILGGKKSSHGPSDDIQRAYESITFTECISSADDYKLYKEEKEIFQENLLGRKKIRDNVPVRFKAKIELHTMMGGEDVKELLKTIEKDEEITNVAFPNIRAKDPKRIPHMFMKNFVPKTGEWKEDALSIEIQLRYAGMDNMASALEKESGFFTEDQLPKPIKLITRCIRRLEGGEDWSISKHSMRGEQKKRSISPSKKPKADGSPTREKKGLPPRKCVSEGLPTTRKLTEGAIGKRASAALLIEEGFEAKQSSISVFGSKKYGSIKDGSVEDGSLGGNSFS